MKVCINHAKCDCHYRLFLDPCEFEIYEDKAIIRWDKPSFVHYLDYPEKKITSSILMHSIPEKDKDKFVFYKPTLSVMTEDKDEMCINPSSLMAAIDILYKRGFTDIMIAGNNSVKEDGIRFPVGYSKIINELLEKYPVNFYQFKKENSKFNIPIMDIKDFIEWKR